VTIGVGIIAFNRPQYLRRLIASLEMQTDLSGCEFHLFLDGAVNAVSGNRYAHQKDIDACARLFERARLPNRNVHRQEHNVNIGIASLEATDTLASTYERIMQLEDDVVLSPDWFRLARVLYDELEAHPDVYSFSPGFRRVGTRSEDAANLGRITYGWHHMWCECFTADRWARIRDAYMEYHAYIAEPDYLERIDGVVREFFDGLGGMPPDLACSQDGGREMAIRRNGMRRALCAVNRALGIGQHGIHFTPLVFKEMGFARQTPFMFAGDATREAFTWGD
jgi:hypothetical protein